MLAIAALFVATLLGWAAGGSFRLLERLSLNQEWLLLGVLVFQGLARGRMLGASPTERGLVAWLCASGVLVAILATNLRTPGVAVALLGTLTNLAVVGINLGMPFGARYFGAGAFSASANAVGGGFYRAIDPSTLLPWLGDAIPLPLGSSVLLLSPGDIALTIGVVGVIVGGMTARVPPIPVRQSKRLHQ